MDKIKIWDDNPSEKQLREISDRLKNGELAIMPTDSVYAIVCDALNPKAVSKICSLKRINPDKNVLAIICPDISTARDYAIFGDSGYKILKDFTPGPYTFIFRISRNLPRAFKGRKEVGIRIPDLNTPRLVSQHLGSPLMTTSIEFDEDDYGLNTGLIAENYDGKVDFMVEGEEGELELTTIVDCKDDEPVVLRHGKGELLK